jgi:hypothetical protein
MVLREPSPWVEERLVAFEVVVLAVLDLEATGQLLVARGALEALRVVHRPAHVQPRAVPVRHMQAQSVSCLSLL